ARRVPAARARPVGDHAARRVMRISRRRDGSFNVKLPDAERELVIGLVGQLRELLVADDAPGLERLFPPAYADDEERELEYRSLVHDELLEKRFAALDIVEATVQESRLDEAQLTAWMGAIN